MTESERIITAVFILAFLIPLVASQIPRLRIPSAVLEILTGIVLGHSGLRLLIAPVWLKEVTTWGLLNLLFLAGMELRFPIKAQANLHSTRSQDKGPNDASLSPLFGAFLYTVASIAVALWISRMFQFFHLTKTPNVTALMLATTSLGVVLPVLKETGLLQKPYGQMLLLSAFMADFITVLCSGFILGHQNFKTSLIAIVGIIAVAIAAYFVGQRLLRRVNQKNNMILRSQLGVRGALAIMAGFGTLASALGTEVMLGGFTGGMVCSLLAGQNHEVLRKKLETISYSLFLPIFFISVGLELNLKSFSDFHFLYQLPLYLFAAFFVKIAASLVWIPFFSWRQMMASGWIMSTRFTLVIALALLAGQAKMLSQSEISTWTITALLTVLLAPWFFNLTIDKTKKAVSN